MDRRPGLSVRLKLTLSYAGFLLLATALMLAAAWLAGRRGQPFELLLRLLPEGAVNATGELVPLLDENDQVNRGLAGRISCDQIVPYPPGIPVLVPGQRTDPISQRFLLAYSIHVRRMH